MKRLNTIRNRKEYTIKKLDFDYDPTNDLLYTFKPNSQVFSSVMIGEFHLEFNKQGEIVGIEVLKASDLLSEYGIDKKLLNNIDKVNIKVVVRNNSLLVFLMVYALEQEKSATITMNNLESPFIKAVAST